MNRLRKIALMGLAMLPIASVAFAAQAALAGVPSLSAADGNPVGGSGPSYSR